MVENLLRTRKALGFSLAPKKQANKLNFFTIEPKLAFVLINGRWFMYTTETRIIEKGGILEFCLPQQ